MNNETDDLSPDHDAALTPARPKQASTFHKIFMGQDGLRAGWSLLIFIALFAVLIFGANVVGHKLHPPAQRAAKTSTDVSPLHGFIDESVPFLAVLLVTWIMSKIERRPVSVYGFGDSRKLPHFLAGLAWGVICLSLLVLTLLKAGFLVIDSRVLFGADILRYGAIWLLGFLLVGLLEEYLYPRLRPVHAHPRPRRLLPVGLQDPQQRSLGLLDRGSHLVHPLRPRPQQQPRRIPHRTALRRPGRYGFLLQPLAHRLALVGHRIPHLVGLGPIFPLRRRRQRTNDPAPSSRHPPRRQAHPQRRSHRPRRQHLHRRHPTRHQPHHSLHPAPRSLWASSQGVRVADDFAGIHPPFRLRVVR